jgi:hypothetical protein
VAEGVILGSAYLPYDDAVLPLPRELERLEAGCRGGGAHLIIGCDGNALHTSWWSSDSNERGEFLFNYIMVNGFDIMNRGNRPTTVTSNRQEVVDIMIATYYAGNFVKNWYLSEEVSCSDQRQSAVWCREQRSAYLLFCNKISQSGYKYQIQNLHKTPRQQLLLPSP